MTVLCIVNVPGIPVPQGSVEAALNRVTGKAYVRGVKPNLAKYRADIREGVERAMVRWQGEWLDRIHFGLLRNEWEARRGASD